MSTHTYDTRSAYKRSVFVSKTDRSFLSRTRKSKAGQATFEYFILFAMFAALCLISATVKIGFPPMTLFERARAEAYSYYKMSTWFMDLDGDSTTLAQ